MNKKLMILGASILQLPAIEKARELGLNTIVVDMNPNAIGFNVEGVQKEVISTIDIPAILEAAKKYKIDGIMTLATDMPMRAVAAVSTEMNLVGIDADTALKATNKAEMRKALQLGGVPIPKYFKVTNKCEYLNAAKQFNVPFIVKPADSSGSRGIFEVVDITDEDLVNKAYEYCHPYSRSGDVVVEEYMNGPEVSVETLSVDGVCHVIQITDKLTTGVPFFVEMGHNQPSLLTNETAHTEIIVTKEGPKIVELGARLGGDNITTHLVPLSTGINMVECSIKIALGEKPNLEKQFDKGSAIRYLKTENGVISRITGIKQAEKINGIKQISIVHDIGSTVEEIKSSIDRIGFVISQNETALDAIKSCEEAIKKIKVEVKK